jgi:hypothetical protein
MSDELLKHTSRAANTLLAVGILQLFCGAVIIVIFTNAQRGRQATLPVLLIAQLGVSAIFFGLYFWARRSPLPATIVGLIVYSTLLILNVINSVSNLAANNPNRPGTGIGGIGVGWMDIVIIVLLVQGIQAGLKYKRLLAQQGM